MIQKVQRTIEQVADSARGNLAVMLAMAALAAVSTAMWSLVMMGIAHTHNQIDAMEKRYLLHDDEQTELILSVHNADLGKVNLMLDNFKEYIRWSKVRWQKHDLAEDACRRERGAVENRVRELEILCERTRAMNSTGDR